MKSIVSKTSKCLSMFSLVTANQIVLKYFRYLVETVGSGESGHIERRIVEGMT